MREFIYLGSAPADEPCVQLMRGDETYGIRAVAECETYLRQIQREMFAKGVELVPGVKLAIKSCPHDFGTYFEVVVEFDSDQAKPCTVAGEIESLLPAEWDDQARSELGLAPA